MNNITSNYTVKSEYYNIMCQGCLSKDRTLKPLKYNLELFLNLLGDPQMLTAPGSKVCLCWECMAHLRHTHTFRTRIQNAQFILQQSLYLTNNSTIPCLTNLSISLLNTPEVTLQHNEISEVEIAGKAQKKLKEKSINLQTNNVELTDFIKEEYLQLSEDYDTPLEPKSDSELETELLKEELGELLKEEYEADTKIKLEDKKSKKKRKKLEKGFKQFAGKAKITPNYQVDISSIDNYFSMVHLDEDETLSMVERTKSMSKNKLLRYNCKSCRIGFKMSVDLKRHDTFVHMAQTKAPFKCLECSTTVASWLALRSHWNKHNFVFKCNVCGVECRRLYDVRSHIQRHTHLYECTACGVSFNCIRDFGRHYNNIHKNLTCDHCGLRCQRKNTMERHMRSQHMVNKCKECNREYNTYNSLRRHYRLQHREVVFDRVVNELSYCVECNKQFASVYKYKRHLKTAVCHTPKTKVSIPCPECGKIFTRKLYMTNHFKLFHEGVSKHQCDICLKYFSSAFGVRKHRQGVHEKLRPPKDKVCDICGRGFHTNRILTHHRRTHTGERPHRCPHCAAAFAQRTALDTHTRTQHKHAADWPRADTGICTDNSICT